VERVAVPLPRVAEASGVDPLFSSTVPVGLAEVFEETWTKKFIAPQAVAGWTAGMRPTVTGALIAVTIRLSDAIAGA
jgi:hypothetical protein